jgi:hypothetical protein
VAADARPAPTQTRHVPLLCRLDSARDGESRIMLIPRTEHIGERPSWDCRVCGEPWPCAPAKVELGEQYGGWPTGLSLYVSSCLLEAIEDMRTTGDGSPTRLFDRFMSWTHVPSAC